MEITEFSILFGLVYCGEKLVFSNSGRMVLLLGCARPIFDMQLENKVVTSGPSPQEFTIKIKSWAHSDAELNQFFISKKQHDQQLPNGNNGAGRNNRSQGFYRTCYCRWSTYTNCNKILGLGSPDELRRGLSERDHQMVEKTIKNFKIKDDNTHRFCDVIPDQRYMRKLNGRLVDEMMTLVFISYQ
ncbi:Piwi domain-containing protein [Rhizophagus irregularis DAOM 181602=DAOM 197198]|nr:Piwi domain-containing protein [Rhizophagus irregularis DAOM 181602=DAOM 197198]